MLPTAKQVTNILGLCHRTLFAGRSISQISRHFKDTPIGMPNIRPVVFCGPSGVGKSTLLKRLMDEYPTCFAFSISHTTRNPRMMEVNGKDYYFVTKEDMLKDIAENKFIEYVENYGNYYGTSIRAIQDITDSGRICVLDVDTNGVESILKTALNPKCIFIRPPCYEELEKRLVRRGTESTDSLNKRLDLAKKELNFIVENKQLFDLVIINDDLEEAYNQLKDFLKEDIARVCSEAEKKL